MIPTLISVKGVSATNTAATVQTGGEPAVKEVRYDIPSGNDDAGISQEVKRVYGTLRSNTEFPNSETNLTPKQADALVAKAALQHLMTGEPPVLSTTEDELRLMEARGFSAGE